MLFLVVVNNLTEEDNEESLLGLLTNREALSLKRAQDVYREWHLRHRIEDGYCFEQEAGLNVEQVMMHFLEGIQRMFVSVLWDTHLIAHILASCPNLVNPACCLGSRLRSLMLMWQGSGTSARQCRLHGIKSAYPFGIRLGPLATPGPLAGSATHLSVSHSRLLISTRSDVSG